ncbi:MAG: DUF4097 family beta strand repeat-containing protein [Candidatus Acidiferrales bacterium]
MSSGRRGRSSIFAGLLLVVLGIIFLIGIFYPGVRLGHWIALYWPVLLIVWGVAKILDYVAAQHFGEPRPALVSGGEAALIALLVIVLGGFVVRGWVRNRYPNINFNMPEFGPSFTRSELLPSQTLPKNARLAIDLRRGDIAVHGKAGEALVVRAQKKIWGLSQTSADRAMQQAQVQVENFGELYRIRPVFGRSGRGRASIDLDLEAPSSASVSASTNHGDIRISNINGSTQAHTNDGDVDVSGAGADVAVNLNHGDARIAGANGNVRVTGRGGDVNISDVNGSASVEGSFDGSIRARNVTQEVHCAQPWSAITVGHLHGTLESDLGDVGLSGASGPVKIVTHNADIDVKNATGRLNISDAHGDIKVALSAPPQQDISITDDAGDVDVTLPPESAFQVEAVSRTGDVQSDFAGDQLNVSNMGDSGQITGRTGASGGPKITIATTYGTIHLRKTSSGR